MKMYLAFVNTRSSPSVPGYLFLGFFFAVPSLCLTWFSCLIYWRLRIFDPGKSDVIPQYVFMVISRILLQACRHSKHLFPMLKWTQSFIYALYLGISGKTHMLTLMLPHSVGTWIVRWVNQDKLNSSMKIKWSFKCTSYSTSALDHA